MLVRAQAEVLTLEQAIASARAQRPAFEAARLRIVQANLSRRALGAFPATRLFVGYSSDQEVGGSDDDLFLAQPIDIFGRTSAARASGTAIVMRAEAEFRAVSVEVQSQVVDAYIEAAASAELARTAASVQEGLERLYEATRLRVEGGVAPGVQLTRVGLELEQAKLRSDRRQAELQANRQRLGTLIGKDYTLVSVQAVPELPISEANEAVLLSQRPDLLLLTADVRIAEADARIARLEGLPEFELQARRTPWQERDQRYGIRLQLSFPIFDYGRVRSETKAAETKAEAARKALADASKLASGELAAARIEMNAAKQQVGRYEALVSTAKDLVERLRPALTEQATTLIEVIDATRTLRDVEEALVEARQRLAQAQSRYLRAAGQIIEVPSR
ncbi:MAG: TolC family protein [Fimbriimonadaceae bacterium]|nr:TolC family protein [Fimbriimonadaceae bacterium]